MYQSADFIAEYARSQRFSSGRPRNFTIDEKNEVIYFLRAVNQAENTLALFSFDLKAKNTKLLVNPLDLIDQKAQIPDAEKARRERMREVGLGITSYQLDENFEKIVFALQGRVFVFYVKVNKLSEIPLLKNAVDPKISPDGNFIAGVIEDGLKLVDLSTSQLKDLLSPASQDVTYGLANFIAAEEFSRISGYWWSSDSKNILVEKVDSSQVSKVNLADPTDPRIAVSTHRYPFAGSENPTSSLALVSVSGEIKDLAFLTQDFEYLVNAGFKNKKEVFTTLLNRKQNHLEVKLYDIKTEESLVFFTQEEAPWVEIVQPLPKFFEEEFIYLTGEEFQQINLNGRLLPGQNFEVRSIAALHQGAIYALVSATPENQALIELTKNGEVKWLTDKNKYCQALKKDKIEILVKHDLTNWQPDFEVRFKEENLNIENLAPAPNFAPNISIEYLKDTNLYAAVIAPNNYQNQKLPVVLSPYSGPHAQRVINSASGYLTEQFLAEQGFLVVVIDSRGTPGRGKEFAQSISSNWAQKVLNDQINGLEELAKNHKWNFDLNQIGIKGWSFGGYLAALAVLERSDFFKAAIAGAPVTDWRWYDTAYSERYLGLPEENANAYEENSLLNKVSGLESPLLLIHGLADDNVLAMHSLQLSAALFAKGKRHNFLSLTGVSHMTQGAGTLENLLKLEVDFFKQHLNN